jgi:hypothetical protein
MFGGQRQVFQPLHAEETRGMQRRGTQTEDSFMSLAKNKFTLLKDANRHNMPSAEEKKILAPQAELKQVSKRWNKKGNKGNKSKETETKKKGDLKEKNKDTKKKAEKPAWMSKKPKEENLRKPKSWNNKDWHWCSSETGGKCNGHWRIQPQTLKMQGGVTQVQRCQASK